jgi:hypothetical protein
MYKSLLTRLSVLIRSSTYIPKAKSAEVPVWPEQARILSSSRSANMMGLHSQGWPIGYWRARLFGNARQKQRVETCDIP